MRGWGQGKGLLVQVLRLIGIAFWYVVAECVLRLVHPLTVTGWAMKARGVDVCIIGVKATASPCKP